MMQRNKRSGGSLFAILGVGLLVTAVGCNSGGRDGTNNIPNLVQAAAPLDFDNAIYRGARMNTPRYGHSDTTLEDGQVLLTGGSDERHFTSMDNAEVYDQTVIEDPAPESVSGTFLDTDFNGDLMIMAHGGRLFHTATLLSDGNVLIAGGSPDILVGEAIGDAEIFDRQSRTFNPSFLQINNQMVVPRFRHTATVLASGQIMLLGGQESVNETIIDPNWPPGHPLFMVDIQTFPSTETIEVFNPATLEFSLLVNQNAVEIELTTNQGRAGHGLVQVGGPDNQINTGDDIYLVAGGYRTFSSLFAPQTKFPNRPLDTFKIVSLEYYDRSVGEIFPANDVTLRPRINRPQTHNLGEFNRFTPDGVDGVTNVAFLSQGNNDFGDNAATPAVSTGAAETASSEIVSVTFTGFGPSNGISFLVLDADTAPVLFGNLERFLSPDCLMARTEAPALQMPTSRSINGEEFFYSWIVTGGGAAVFPANLGTQDQTLVSFCSGTDVVSFEYYDMYYDASATTGDPNDLLDLRSDQHPTGIVGSWLAADLFPAEDTFDNYGPAVPDGGPILPDATIYHSLSQLPGEDGILNTPDDRVLVAGGGDSWIATGGEPTGVSSLVFLPAGAND